MEEKKVAVPPAAETGEEELIEQAKIRREKLAKLQSEGKNPYEQVKYAVDADSETLKNNFEAYEGKTVSLAGRMMSRRIMGKASFSHIADRSGSIQIYVTRQDVGEENYLSYKRITISATSWASRALYSRRRRAKSRCTSASWSCSPRLSFPCPKNITGFRIRTSNTVSATSISS